MQRKACSRHIESVKLFEKSSLLRETLPIDGNMSISIYNEEVLRVAINATKDFVNRIGRTSQRAFQIFVHRSVISHLRQIHIAR